MLIFPQFISNIQIFNRQNEIYLVQYRFLCDNVEHTKAQHLNVT